MNKTEEQFVKLLSPLRSIQPSASGLRRALGSHHFVTKVVTSRYSMWWAYAISPVVAVAIIFLVRGVGKPELGTEADLVAMQTEAEQLSHEVQIDLVRIEEDNISKLGLQDLSE